MVYRNELAAAQHRADALDKEVRDLRSQVSGFREEREAKVEEIVAGLYEGREEESKQYEEERRGDKLARKSLTKWSFLESEDFLAMYGVFSFFAVCYAISVPSPSLLFLIAFSFFPLWWGGWRRGESLLEAEKVRLSKLPFSVHGHEELLRKNFERVEVTVDFFEPVRFGETQNETAIVRPKDIATETATGNRPYVAWFRRNVEERLVHLHGSSPIKSVRLVAVPLDSSSPPSVP